MTDSSLDWSRLSSKEPIRTPREALILFALLYIRFRLQFKLERKLRAFLTCPDCDRYPCVCKLRGPQPRSEHVRNRP